MTPVTIAIFVLGLMLIVVGSVIVAAPLFQPEPSEPVDEPPGAGEGWERQKRQALAAIREAEFDHQMGKLSDDDLATMRARFEAQALEAIAALERRPR